MKRKHYVTRSLSVFILLFSLIPIRAQFGPRQLVLTGDATVRQVVGADLDGDTDNDLVMGDSTGCYLLMNLDGAGTFSAPDTVALVHTVISHGALGVTDMDGDGDVDLVLHDTETRQLSLYANDGSGAFALPQVIASTHDYGFIQEVQCADITGSVLPEVIIVYGATVRWFINEGGTFSTTDSLQHAIGTECRNLLVGDVDMDGDPDHTVSDLDGVIHVGINAGDGTAWSSLPLAYNFGTLHYYGHTLIDVDADGDLDFVDGMNEVRWLENTVADSGSWGDYTVHSVASDSTQGACWTEHIGCSDGASILWCPWPYVTPLRWSHYDAPSGEMSAPVLLSGLPPAGDGRLYFGDLDGDGRKDLITFHQDTLSWFANTISAEATVPPLDLVCAGDLPYQLPDGIPAGGVWTGDLVAQNVFDAASAAAGVYTVTYSAHDSLGCSASTSADLVVEICTGVMSATEETSIALAPNPAHDLVTIMLPGTGVADLEVMDATGRLIARHSRVSSPVRLELANVPPGMYHLRSRRPDGSTATGVLIVR